MTSERTSHRHVLWATSIIGGATLAALVIGLVRNKAVALIGGAEAVGLLGLYTSLVATAASLATLGIDSSAVRLLAQNANDPIRAQNIRRAVWTIACPFALIGALLFWFLRGPISELVIGARSFSGDVGWLAIGVAASVLGAVQIGIIQAYGRVGDAARVRLWGSLISTLIAIAAIYQLGLRGILVAVVIVPLTSYLLGVGYGRQLPSTDESRSGIAELREYARLLIGIGAAVMISQAVGNLSALAGRAIVTRELGLGAAGLYQASNAIISVNLTLLLNAMTADYYPRVSQVANDPDAMSTVLNQQFHVILVLAAPAMLLVSVAAPMLLSILYSSHFTDGALLLRFFLAGSLIRLLYWSLGFVVLARGAGALFLLGEVAGSLFVPATWVLVPVLGLSGAGPAAVLGAAATCIVYLIAAWKSGVRLDRANIALFVVVLGLLIAIAILFESNALAATIAGLTAASALGVRSLRELRAILRS